MATDTTADAPIQPVGSTTFAGEDVRRRPRSGLLIPVLLLLVAATLRFYALGYPERIYFDETYYAPQGREMIERGVEEGFAVHPPVGKWLIGGGIAIFGYSGFGFRAASAAAGT